VTPADIRLDEHVGRHISGQQSDDWRRSQFNNHHFVFAAITPLSLTTMQPVNPAQIQIIAG